MRGKVNEMALRYGFFKDHPRLCGEKFGGWDTALATLGSPPPMRGKANTLTDSGWVDGITPAYAGKSMTQTTNSTKSTDHPRLCGEKGARLVAGSQKTGITPAYAGKSE